MKHGDKPWMTDHLLALCLIRPPLLSRQGLGQTAGGAEEKPRTWDLQTSGSLTSALDKHGGATNPKFQKVRTAFEFDFDIDYFMWL